jgi:hypothetical protein
MVCGILAQLLALMAFWKMALGSHCSREMFETDYLVKERASLRPRHLLAAQNLHTHPSLELWEPREPQLLLISNPWSYWSMFDCGQVLPLMAV